MSKDILIPGSDAPIIGSVTPEHLDPSAVHELQVCLVKIHTGNSITSGELGILTGGMEHTATRSQVLSNLLYPHCSSVLEDVLDHPVSTGGLDQHSRAELVSIACEADDSVRVHRLCELVIDRLQPVHDSKTNPPWSHQEVPAAVTAKIVSMVGKAQKTGEIEQTVRNSSVTGGSTPGIDHLLRLVVCQGSFYL